MVDSMQRLGVRYWDVEGGLLCTLAEPGERASARESRVLAREGVLEVAPFLGRQARWEPLPGSVWPVMGLRRLRPPSLGILGPAPSIRVRFGRQFHPSSGHLLDVVIRFHRFCYVTCLASGYRRGSVLPNIWGTDPDRA